MITCMTGRNSTIANHSRAHKMWQYAVFALVGVVGWSVVSCSITCLDGKQCSDFETCCRSQEGYSCCHYPQAVCCSDLAHCCPWGFRCNQATMMCEREGGSSIKVPMLAKGGAWEPGNSLSRFTHLQGHNSSQVRVEGERSSVVHCDECDSCPAGTTCCRRPKGAWFCCPASTGKCCLDDEHCCPHGYDCDLTYTQCVRQSQRYPSSPRKAPVYPAIQTSSSEDHIPLKEKTTTALVESNGSSNDIGVIRCNSKFYCPAGNTCCQQPKGGWGCCPYPVGMCCSDGFHCCQYGYKCQPSSLKCKKICSGAKKDEKLRPFS